jgi:phosphocarrier protein HPr
MTCAGLPIVSSHGSVTAVLLRVEKELTVLNELGLHARPAAMFVRCASEFQSEIRIFARGESFSACSILEVLIANLDQGATFTVVAEGRDAAEAIHALEELMGRLQ